MKNWSKRTSCPSENYEQIMKCNPVTHVTLKNKPYIYKIYTHTRHGFCIYVFPYRRYEKIGLQGYNGRKPLKIADFFVTQSGSHKGHKGLQIGGMQDETTQTQETRRIDKYHGRVFSGLFPQRRCG